MPFDQYFTASKVRVSNPEANRQWDELMKLDYREQRKIIDAIREKDWTTRTAIEIKLKRRWEIRGVQKGHAKHFRLGKVLQSREAQVPIIYRGFNTAP